MKKYAEELAEEEIKGRGRSTGRMTGGTTGSAILLGKRTAGKLAGRAIGYVQLARGQFNTIMHQTQARQVHKELQDTIAQLEAIRHEIRTVSFMNPSPLTRRLVDNLDQTSAASGNNEPEKPDTANRSTTPDAKNYGSTNLGFSDMQSQATAYAKLAKSTAINSGSAESNECQTSLKLTRFSNSIACPLKVGEV
ncbi:hypothetical protein TEA_022647 [Camellia sinensis var. sinensis]|uniref:Uncharacterized protein n=1 Tax=Camellia sinensis var. sinensis TaxID=542762 RepID=A0A4S4DNG3_CAMSN|nr:hypothetical protein TEA_022647 [Camellia sinensis var. sinensis]